QYIGAIGTAKDLGISQDNLREYLEKKQPHAIISGMALGVDTLWALAAIDLKIRVLAAVPFEGQELVWTKKAKSQYYNVIDNHLTTRYVISKGGYNSKKMQIRNEWMVNNSSELVVVMRKNTVRGGTFNCYKYALATNKKIYRIYPNDYK
ncbi:DUF1273 family protein, partial [Patescibacteria group bacterium]|nr:DUF1273 family protein [Patescibacteria group bacterium]